MSKLIRALTAGMLVLGLRAVLMAQTPPHAPATAHTTPTTAFGGTIEFATASYDAGRIRSGDVVKYSYVFTNAGQQTLEVANLSACGCIHLGNWTRTVEPGKTGVIPIEFNSTGFHSGPIFKGITVTCSDKDRRVMGLQFRGTIWQPVEVEPAVPSISVSPEAASGSTVITITNNCSEPVVLSNLQCNTTSFAAELKTNAPGWAYQLLVRRVPPLSPGTMLAQVTLKTSFTNPATLTIPVWANVRPPFAVMPAFVTLPQGPLLTGQRMTVAIRNFTTNAVVLSDAVVTAKGVQAQLKEVEPGRLFSVLLSFPQGFELAPRADAELTIKSSHPSFPLIKVPIRQAPRPAAAPTVKPPTHAASLSLPQARIARQ